ncbi:uroporphyrinogen decarboxylase [Clostridia bacterium]|nr:uroporphyrinogen decarboxylase [Clostridia bacterium]
MNPKERFYASVEYRTPDRPPLVPLAAQNPVWEKLYDSFGVKGYKEEKEYGKPEAKYYCYTPIAHEEFQRKIGEDFRRVEPRYTGPELSHYEDNTWEGFWGERYKYSSLGWGEFVEDIYRPFANVQTPEELDDFRMPSADWFDYSGVEALCDQYEGYAIFTGDAGHGDFINGNAFCRGVEQTLMDIALEDPVWIKLSNQRFDFFYEKIRRTLEAANGKIDVVYFGDDLGTQLAPVINPDTFSKLIAPYYEKLFAMVHSFGAKTMMHSCGSVRHFISGLIDSGLDILDTVQTDAANMDIEDLHQEYYKKIVFCGTLSVQTLLPKGTPEEITAEIEKRKRLFAEGGIFIGPSNIMQNDMPIENFVAMLKAIGTIA